MILSGGKILKVTGSLFREGLGCFVGSGSRLAGSILKDVCLGKASLKTNFPKLFRAMVNNKA